MTFSKHPTYRLSLDGSIERRIGELPSVVSLPPVTVSLAPTTRPVEAARLLRKLADELEAQP